MHQVAPFTPTVNGQLQLGKNIPSTTTKSHFVACIKPLKSYIAFLSPEHNKKYYGNIHLFIESGGEGNHNERVDKCKLFRVTG